MWWNMLVARFYKHIHDFIVIYSVNITNVTYVLSQTQQQKCGALIDRGANGGIAGNDTCILNTHPTRKVDIQGIDNHQLPDIPIVTAGAVVNTQRGEVILVMHQYSRVQKEDIPLVNLRHLGSLWMISLLKLEDTNV